MKNLFKKYIYFILVLNGLLLLSGCLFPSKETNLQYVYDKYGLNYDQGDKLYLQHNVWYTDPMNILSVNYHEGKIIPFGTQIKILKAFPGYVVFKTEKDGKEYKIINDKISTLLTDEAQFHRIIGNKNPLKNLKISEKYLDALIKGKILQGMTRDEVLLAYGKPPRALNPPYSKITWIYILNDQYEARHIVFKNNKVVYVFDC